MLNYRVSQEIFAGNLLQYFNSSDKPVKIIAHSPENNILRFVCVDIVK